MSDRTVNITVADAIAEFLSDQGVRFVFGVPGGENVPLIEAFRQRGVKFILMHHEAQAAMAAGVCGEISGRPGVCLATVGPGAVNLLSGVAAANLERGPLIAITAEVDHSLQDRVTHMNLDLNAIFSPAVKGSYSLSPQNCREFLLAGWELARSGPSGAVHLTVSLENSMARVGPTGPQFSPVREENIQKPGLNELASRMGASRQTIILIGQGIQHLGLQQAVINLAEEWNAPVVVAPKAKGQFPESHPLFAGCFSAYGDRPVR
ncbi:MAG: thiamine pyrophosphate-binding protein, partial [Anaerolineales bacterium]|nr:thiamine pyrophosphate-binding protein [Anaerolineales bacterium]